jgi:hypothetical protein
MSWVDVGRNSTNYLGNSVVFFWVQYFRAAATKHRQPHVLPGSQSTDSGVLHVPDATILASPFTFCTSEICLVRVHYIAIDTCTDSYKIAML